MSVPCHRLGRRVAGLILLVAAMSVSAQEDQRSGNSPLGPGDVVISAGVGLPLVLGYAGETVSLWGASVTSEFVIARTVLWDPVELTFGAGAGGHAIFTNPLWWSAAGFAGVHVFGAQNFATYSRLGLGYFRWGEASVSLQGVTFFGAGGVEYFVSDHLAVYVEAGWLAPATVGVRVRL